MWTFDRTIRQNMYDIGASQTPFVDAGGCNPNAPIGLPYRYISARRSCHSVAIDSLHRLEYLVTRMQQLPLIGHDQYPFVP